MASYFSACPAANMSSTWVGRAQPDRGLLVTEIPVYTLNALGAESLPPTVGTKPMRVRCLACKGEVTTRLVTALTRKTYLCALTLYICMISGACWPFICLPYFINYSKTVRHYCPNCGCHIGSYTT
ncbi:LOW QUALITY PROTEIN: uncharacterized protein Dere_GG21062 [Drosophila erecta]|uniref:LITAF domain-containing protein n=1 Tax=Drosophila erecta TaxID=7220 RepID=B3NLH3_DROER|nr:LOW QUALITY PROTEIN: uncharacterized protein Dere_GG21062 [Drosophila erecta]